MYSRHYYFVKWKEKKEIFLYYSFKRGGGLIIYTRYYYFIKWKEKKKKKYFIIILSERGWVVDLIIYYRYYYSKKWKEKKKYLFI